MITDVDRRRRTFHPPPSFLITTTDIIVDNYTERHYYYYCQPLSITMGISKSNRITPKDSKLAVAKRAHKRQLRKAHKLASSTLQSTPRFRGKRDEPTLTCMIVAGYGPPKRDLEAAQGHRWLQNELRKPGIRLSNKAVSQFNLWCSRPDMFIPKLRMDMKGKQVMGDEVKVAVAQFELQRQEARRAQSVEKGAKDWWVEAPGRNEREKRAWRILVEDSGTIRVDELRKKKMEAQKDGDEEAGGVALPVDMDMETEGTEEQETIFVDGDEWEGLSDVSVEGPVPVTRAATEDVDDVL
ncbi:MAG: hypothetical protein Q9208_006069 [Pyrenodesmia sp. 3 TL-2023]